MSDKRHFLQFKSYPFLEENSKLEDSDINVPFGESKFQLMSKISQCQANANGNDNYDEYQLKNNAQSEGKHFRYLKVFFLMLIVHIILDWV
jgi:hypothetical protein